MTVYVAIKFFSFSYFAFYLKSNSTFNEGIQYKSTMKSNTSNWNYTFQWLTMEGK